MSRPSRLSTVGRGGRGRKGQARLAREASRRGTRHGAHGSHGELGPRAVVPTRARSPSRAAPPLTSWLKDPVGLWGPPWIVEALPVTTLLKAEYPEIPRAERPRDRVTASTCVRTWRTRAARASALAGLIQLSHTSRNGHTRSRAGRRTRPCSPRCCSERPHTTFAAARARSEPPTGPRGVRRRRYAGRRARWNDSQPCIARSPRRRR